jgi:hypothetical protein
VVDTFEVVVVEAFVVDEVADNFVVNELDEVLRVDDEPAALVVLEAVVEAKQQTRKRSTEDVLKVTDQSRPRTESTIG